MKAHGIIVALHTPLTPSGEIHEEARDAACIGRAHLSTPVSPYRTFTRWLPEALARTGLPQGIPCVMGAGTWPGQSTRALPSPWPAWRRPLRTPSSPSRRSG